LARYALIADGEQIHSAMYPGSFAGPLFAEQAEINVRQHALESACFVVCATAWLDADQQAQIMKDTGCRDRADFWRLLHRHCGSGRPDYRRAAQNGEGEVIAELDFAQIDARKRAHGRPRSLQPPRTPQLADRSLARVARP
jgi:aliphatic nitrilase